MREKGSCSNQWCVVQPLPFVITIQLTLIGIMALAPSEHKKEERFYAISFCLMFVVVLLFMPKILPRNLEANGCCFQNLPLYDPVDDVTNGKCDYCVPWE